RAHWPIGVVALIVLGGASVQRARAQADLRDITQPIPVVTSGGHSAPVRSLIFASRDGSQLLSAGMDKIINVWNLGETPPGLARTIRPRIWRGYAGAIHAMALSPTPDRNGQRTLALAGFGVQNTRGEIGLFRFPGLNSRPTGDVEAQLPSGGLGEEEPQGHLNSVTCLAFDPRGGFLCSGSNDTTARIWDLKTRRTVAVLSGHAKAINALAYSPDGRRLVTAGADGVITLWDVDRRVRLNVARPDPRRRRPGGPEADAIHALGLSPDGRWVVVGRENGDLIRYDAADLPRDPPLAQGGDRQGAVEALAISPDSTKLVTSVVSRALAVPGERPRVACDIELRALPSGAVQARLARSSNLVYACAFSPDGRRVAFAGGDNQGITVTAPGDPSRPAIELAGQGSSLWDVGFSRDSQAIGFARRRPDGPEPQAEYEDFDLKGRRLTPFRPEELSRAVTTWDGWTVRPVTPWTLDVLDARKKGYRIELDPKLDRRWWSYSFLPPGPGHPRPSVAIGCEAGVAIYGLDDGRRTRLFAGHHGPVYALAPSPDGRWLVTGSSDQTARFWRLAGSDTLASLGTRIAPEAGRRGKVAQVEPRGFAEAMGLRVGDLVDKLYIGGDEKTDLNDLDHVPPNTMIEFLVARDGKRVPLNTTKRDSPALSLFPALDREWVLWTPRGYYETSALGDRRYLGWHRNRVAPDQPTDYFSFDHFERELRQPGALIRFLETADLGALAPDPVREDPRPLPIREPEQVVAEDRLPTIRVVEPARPAFAPLVMQGTALPMRVEVSSEDQVAGRGLIHTLRVLVDGGRAAEIVINPPLSEVDRRISLNLNPGRHRVSVTAVNDREKSRTENFDVIAPEPPRPPTVDELDARPPQLVVLAIGADRFAGREPALPPIPFAVEGSRDVGSFLGAPQGSPRFRRVDVQSILGPDATAARILAALVRLDDRRKEGELGRSDSVFVVIESHLLSLDPEAGPFRSRKDPPRSPLPPTEVPEGRVRASAS
ncbi:MAG: WD40 repeat domain-containing protein, partial [Singulisphaera sp.]